MDSSKFNGLKSTLSGIALVLAFILTNFGGLIPEKYQVYLNTALSILTMLGFYKAQFKSEQDTPAK